MSRSRNIKPTFFINELLPEIAPLGRLLFIGLWCISDREGRLEDRPKRIKIELLPSDDCDVDQLLDALQSRDFIRRYEIEGHRFIQVVNFAKHQSPHHQERESRIPAPESFEVNQGRVRGKPRTNPGLIQDKHETSPVAIALIPDSLIPDSKTLRSPADADSLTDGFAEFWKAYPRKVSKPQALKAWRKLKPDTQAQTAILAGLKRARRSDQWVRGSGQFIPHPATWLNGRRWEDEETDTAAQALGEQWEGV